MTKYKYGNPEAPIVLIQPVGDHDLPEIEGEVAQIRKLTALDFQMIAVKVDDWNLDLSPWRSPAEKTRNLVMATVGDCIREAHAWLQQCGIRSTLEWNPGNHFRDPGLRTAKAFAWVMKNS